MPVLFLQDDYHSKYQTSETAQRKFPRCIFSSKIIGNTIINISNQLSHNENW